MRNVIRTSFLLAFVPLLACTKFATPLPDGSSQDAPANQPDAASDQAAVADSQSSIDAAADQTAAADSQSSIDADAASDAPAAVSDAAPDAQPGFALGHACTTDPVCASGHCASGICCDQACTGPCAQCSSAGACQMPADDPACGTIACPPDTTCRDYATSITTNRCKAIGECKGATDCTYVDAPAKKYCGIYQNMSQFGLFCDGAGNCTGPVVHCGADGDCVAFVQSCCLTSGGGSSCSSSSCPQHLGPYLCDEESDCPSGYVCCAFSNPANEGTICRLPQDCASDPVASAAVVCNPNVTPSECTTGTCQPSGSPVGYYVCM